MVTSRSVAVNSTRSFSARNQDIGKDGQGRARADDILHGLQAVDELFLC